MYGWTNDGKAVLFRGHRDSWTLGETHLYTAAVTGGAAELLPMPESALANVKGEWIIEGYGVDLDIEVENDPKSVLAGKDPQLERAVTEVMNKLKVKPTTWPKRPAAPVKTK